MSRITFARRLVPVALVVLFGCAGAGAAGHDLAHHEQACRPQNHEPPSAYECHYDTDCTICHDGSRCGAVMSVAETTRRGAECRREDAAQCEAASPRCCDGRCVVALWMP